MDLFKMLTTRFPDANLGEIKQMGDFLIAYHKSSPETQERIKELLLRMPETADHHSPDVHK